MSLQPSGAYDGGIDPVIVIGCAHDDNALSAADAVQLFEKGIDDLDRIVSVVVFEFLPVADGIQLVHEQDGWHGCPCGYEVRSHGLQQIPKVTP